MYIRASLKELAEILAVLHPSFLARGLARVLSLAGVGQLWTQVINAITIDPVFKAGKPAVVEHQPHIVEHQAGHDDVLGPLDVGSEPVVQDPEARLDLTEYLLRAVVPQTRLSIVEVLVALSRHIWVGLHNSPGDGVGAIRCQGVDGLSLNQLLGTGVPVHSAVVGGPDPLDIAVAYQITAVPDDLNIYGRKSLAADEVVGCGVGRALVRAGFPIQLDEGAIHPERQVREAVLDVVFVGEDSQFIFLGPFYEVAGPGYQSFSHLTYDFASCGFLDSRQVTALGLWRG